ncbi:aldehyde dehydrogenase family 3 member B3-like [Parambassis ranga]|uniref:Aldehyde dehydrogenase n=1 Tax=Parambassis ranga TaxID=210632 RepID=A0A6P7HVQ0_9TELE|nr:aldehyde dehydrogenase family 3 member B3-like [Parambassis ranga]XP_028254601.1 aldehyde dehydrogenase family 3 member B3-like [Parambassis ranga]XP_028254602.1 aldehyde dehydrogenase family 3 member B3-like [Parambassis ranga]XP_028254603.1 aldehyde dehydrogenase family 3 member B3-like [Parambassis ranga]XP_028254666.1 aldehyde dehydrogenase family 3 member B3-like [Parambassis ranga]XP_028254667.1 aldehyde dehydrogenase family 3 member B3-like [Parambassis ranga]XP_028254668.1 aldehyde
MDSHRQAVDRLRSAFHSGVTLPEKFRRTQLTNLMSMIKENEEQILTALHKDLGKPKFEAILSEIDIVLNELHYAISNLTSWMQPEYVSKNLATKLDDCSVRREPFGVVLIIGAWNYPLQLLTLPMVGAIAAGNCVVIKPSEVSAATDSLIAELIPKYLSQDCYAVVRGGAEETKALLQIRFDHIFYTGSQSVARSIMQAASVHLTPVTLELGGKCPGLIYGRINITAAARRLVWAKFFNAGQSCVAPDYLLCTAATRDALLPALSQALEDFYGKEPQKSPDMSRIVSLRHWSRLIELLGKTSGKVVVGGERDQEDKYIAPTVVVDVAEDDVLMKEEIFGPILPIITVESVEKGIDFVNRKEKPLALYVFSDESSVVKTVLEKTSSGGFCSNDGIVHMTLPTLPFGGVGASGWGSYHGRWGFETFSHRRACMLRGWALERLNGLRYPPYSEDKLSWLRWTTSPKSCTLM